MKLTKDEALAKIEELKKYVEAEDKFVTLFSTFGCVLYESSATSQRGAVIEALSFDFSLQNVNLSGLDLSGLNLSGLDLSGASLRGVSLIGTNLRGVDLRGADLYQTELQNAQFCGKGGTQKLNRDQVDTFLLALGFVVVEV